MSFTDSIPDTVAKLVKKYKTNDPIELADCLGIDIMWTSEFTKLKGMYAYIKRNGFIMLNRNLDENKLRIVCAHEIGHHILHREDAKVTPFQEFELYNMNNSREYEANIFAASLLLDDDTVMKYVYEYGYSAPQIAATMKSNINLVALKIAVLKTKGHDFNKLDYNSDFLKQ